MNLNRLILNKLSLSLMALALVMACPSPAHSQPPNQQQGWDAPPSEFNDIQRRGFHEGIEGARKDHENHRKPDPKNRDEYRHPHDIPKDLLDSYREAFVRGYAKGVNRYYGE